MNADGSGQARLTNNPAGDADPDWGTAPSSPPFPTCKGQDATIVGTDGNDNLVGTSNRDVIVGLGSNDHISGLGGMTLCVVAMVVT